MVHQAQLKIDNKEYNIIECEYEFMQPLAPTKFLLTEMEMSFLKMIRSKHY